MNKLMTYDEWLAKFKPVQNTISPSDILDGTGFETFGADLKHVCNELRAEPAKIWTVVEGDDSEEWHILPGYHFVNRICYLISEVPRLAEDELISVHID